MILSWPVSDLRVFTQDHFLDLRDHGILSRMVTLPTREDTPTVPWVLIMVTMEETGTTIRDSLLVAMATTWVATIMETMVVMTMVAMVVAQVHPELALQEI